MTLLYEVDARTVCWLSETLQSYLQSARDLWVFTVQTYSMMYDRYYNHMWKPTIQLISMELARRHPNYASHPKVQHQNISNSTLRKACDRQ